MPPSYSFPQFGYEWLLNLPTLSREYIMWGNTAVQVLSACEILMLDVSPSFQATDNGAVTMSLHHYYRTATARKEKAHHVPSMTENFAQETRKSLYLHQL